MFVHTLQFMMITLFLLAVSALFKAFHRQALPDTSSTVGSGAKIKAGASVVTSQSSSSLFEHRQPPALAPFGWSPKHWYDTTMQQSSLTENLGGAQQRPSRARKSSRQTSWALLVPLHPKLLKSSRPPISCQWNGRSWHSAVRSPHKMNAGSSVPSSVGPPYRAPPLTATPVSRGSSPRTGLQSKNRNWNGRLEFGKEEIDTEKKLAKFLAATNNRLGDGSMRSAGLATASAVQASGSGSSSNPVSITSISSTCRSAVRVLRISSGCPKTGSPKSGETEMPLPMSIDQATEVFKRLGVYLQIERWRDGIRQWFSDVLLNPLVGKIDTSHLQAMAAAAKLGISLSVAQIGGSEQDTGLACISSEGSQHEWLTTMVCDEDSFLHQLRAALTCARDGLASMENSLFGLAPPQARVYNPHMQVCLDAVTEHQRLKALMKGEWVKGLLPQASVQADYTVQRIRDLARGTCVKAYEFWPHGDAYVKNSKSWTSELPIDAHVLVYLFGSLLEHPQWMLHVDPTAYPSTQSGNNCLFVAGLPHEECHPEKYVAIISGAPSVLHAGATVLAVGKSSPPVFALYWDKKLQFSSQGCLALWDAILLLCYRVKVAHGGVVRGINLGSPAFNLFSVLEPSVGSSARQ